jgi:hypothetical protein
MLFLAIYPTVRGLGTIDHWCRLKPRLRQS